MSQPGDMRQDGWGGEPNITNRRETLPLQIFKKHDRYAAKTADVAFRHKATAAIEMPGKITILSTSGSTFQFQFRTGSGERVFSGEPRHSARHAMEDALSLKRSVSEDGRYAVARDAQGRFYFNFIGDDGGSIGVSAPHPTPEGLGRAIAALKKEAPEAQLREDLAG
jgi:uncharacterized protein YegP (UPF0339 family)